jgi:alanine-synthesizing transaminase
MFSRRTPASLASNRLSAALAGRRRAGLPVLDLTRSNPTQCGIALPQDEILAALANPRALAYSPDPKGWAGARIAVAAHHARQGFHADPERLFLAASTSEAYSWAFKLLCEPGDEVLAPRPSYPLFECLAALDGVTVRSYPLCPELHWAIDRQALESLLTPRTRALIVVNPNNPTGSYVHAEDWAYLAGLAERRGLAILSDEVFFDYRLHPGPPASSSLALADGPLVLTLSGLSKIAALPQMKLGWMHVSGPEAIVREACERLEWIADAYLSVSAPVLYAAPAWLGLADRIQPAVLARCQAAQDACQSTLRGPVRAWPAEAGWTTIVEGPRTVDGETLALALLEQRGVLVQPGYFYDFPRDGFLALSLLTPPGEAAEGARAIEEIWLRCSDFPPACR